MTRSVIALIVVLFISSVHATPVEVQFETSDGITVFGDLYSSADGKSAPIILLFHQASGDARGEYSYIANRLSKAGCNVLAIDQRAGGDRFGGMNRTKAALDVPLDD